MNTQILAADSQAIQQAAAYLRASEVVAIPTETVYGLAGHAFDPAAVAKIFAAKERPQFDPLIVHLAAEPGLSLAALAAQRLICAEQIPQHLKAGLERLIQTCWPGPLTLVLPRHPRVPDLVSAGLPTVALRVPQHPVAQALISQTFPLAAPSANRFGRISPTHAQAVYSELQGRIPLILDGGPCEIGLESSVLGIEDEQLCLLRPGRLGISELTELAQSPVILAQSHPAEIKAPGMLKSHYAPRLPLFLAESRSDIQRLLAEHAGRPGLLTLSTLPAELMQELQHRQARLCCLSADGNLAEVAHHLFAGLRQLDQEDPPAFLIAELPAPAEGLAHAIRNRLQKAAAR